MKIEFCLTKMADLIINRDLNEQEKIKEFIVMHQNILHFKKMFTDVLDNINSNYEDIDLPESFTSRAAALEEQRHYQILTFLNVILTIYQNAMQHMK